MNERVSLLDAAVVADFLDTGAAEQLAHRLVAEGVGAQVWASSRAALLLPAANPPIGPTVVVRRSDHAHALVLARLFAEVDAGTSTVAPPPTDFWGGEPYQRLLGAGLVLMLCFALFILLLAAAR